LFAWLPKWSQIMHDQDNDGKFPDESPVEVRYPRSKQEEHGAAIDGRGCQEPS
jgi:hypothetical protein